MVRLAFLNEIRGVLENHEGFRAEDFDLTEGSTVMQTQPRRTLETVTIEYLFAPGFSFRIVVKEGHGSVTSFTFTASPGDVSKQQTGNAANRDHLSSALSQWLDRLHEELVLVPVNRQIQEQRQRVETLGEGTINCVPREFTVSLDVALDLTLTPEWVGMNWFLLTSGAREVARVPFLVIVAGS